ncbi:MAG TPA: transcription antitermination factor NusB [Bryobacteraceae bacterium]|nr:transcription antitermination factor NusB [Bryobacteraceae bacterium]
MPIAPARTTAFDILRKVEKGGYASDLLLLHTAALPSRDAGLAAEIVFGVLRYQVQLDYLIEHYSGRRRKLDAEVRIAMRMGIYQLRYLERIPAHAAVTDAVELVKRAHKRSAASLVNAVLRQVDRDAVAWPTREVELSCPEWLLARWERHYGADAAGGIARAALKQPEAYFRLPMGQEEAGGAEERDQGVARGPGGPPHNTGGKTAGATGRMQDIGSQSIVPLLRLAPGHSFLDLCAAPGNKTAQALESGVRAIACDLHFHRIAQMKTLTPDLVVLDGTRPLPFGRPFDRILVDVPCSGTGTLGRNPEIKWRLTPADLDELPRRQAALLANARAALAPGGLLVYATCSLEPEENEAVAAAVPHDLIVETMRRIPGRDHGDGFFATVIKSEQSANG